jgi:ligand-binding SRPBCC domain-containing protein
MQVRVMLRVADTAQLHSQLLDKSSTVIAVDPNVMIYLLNLASMAITAQTLPKTANWLNHMETAENNFQRFLKVSIHAPIKFRLTHALVKNLAATLTEPLQVKPSQENVKSFWLVSMIPTLQLMTALTQKNIQHKIAAHSSPLIFH